MSSLITSSFLVCGDRKTQEDSLKKIISERQTHSIKHIIQRVIPTGTSIGIQQIRTLTYELAHSSLQQVIRYIVIEKADTLTEQAQNALLRVLEEPREDICFILYAEKSSALLPTVVSRCAVIESQAITATILVPTDLSSKTLSELFSLAEKASKKEELALQFVHNVLMVIRLTMRTGTYKDNLRLLSFSEFLLQSSEWIKMTNGNVRLILENCVWGIGVLNLLVD